MKNKINYLQPGLQSISSPSYLHFSIWIYCSNGYRFNRANT